jgi:uncharacterized protein
MRAFLRALIMLTALLATLPACAAPQDIALGRYEARTIVTGTDLRSRPTGLGMCLIDVLVKVSGDPAIASDPRAVALAAHAADFVADFDYWDRMSGIPHHDEQGSYDRPYNLTVRFVPGRIDAALRDLGRAAWPDPRPEIVPLIHVRTANGAFDLTDAEPRADGMRAALAESGERYGMRVRIGTAAESWTERPPASPQRVVVLGSLVLSDAALGWVGKWHVDWQGRGYDWGLSGVNFDEAFRQAVRGATQIVSGHGAPH